MTFSSVKQLEQRRIGGRELVSIGVIGFVAKYLEGFRS